MLGGTYYQVIIWDIAFRVSWSFESGCELSSDADLLTLSALVQPFAGLLTLSVLVQLLSIYMFFVWGGNLCFVHP